MRLLGRSVFRGLLLRLRGGPLPGVLPAADFQQACDWELARSERGGHALSMVLFAAEEGARADLAPLAELLTRRLRLADCAGWLDREQIAVLLPYTDGNGAWTLAESVRAELARSGLRLRCAVSTNRRAPDDETPEAAERPLAVGRLGREAGAAKARAGGRGRGGDDGSQGGGGGGAPGAAVASPTRSLPAPPADARALSSEERPVDELWRTLARPLPAWRRALDVVVAGGALVLLSPLFAAIALAVRLDSPGPVVFRQTRVGLGGRPFTLYKFRSMRADAEALREALEERNEMDGPVFKIRDDPRLTRVGRFLRPRSLDELPQFWNVLKGDMTLVGPRPPLPRELPGYARWQLRRLTQTVGLTCIWQVSGRNDVGFDDWMRMDVRYLRSRSFWLDLKLIASTAWALVTGRGAY